MTILLISYGSRGDVEPMLALGVALRSRGAPVRLCAPPDFGELAQAAGLPLTPVGQPLRALAEQAVRSATPKKLPDIAAELAASSSAAILETGADCEVVVASGSLPAAAGAQAAAEKLGVRYWFAALCPRYLPSPHHPPLPWPGLVLPEDETDNRVIWRANAANLHRLFGPTINVHRATLGLPPTESLTDQVQTDHPLVAADAVLGPWPEPSDLAAIQTGAWVRRDDRPLPSELERFLDAGAPPVYVGFGSMPLRDPAAMGTVAIGAARAQGRRVVLSSGWADLTAVDDGEDCLVVGEVNQQALFPRVAAVVHHGGAGTTRAAAAAGVPQVVVPQIADQFYWAERVAALGIGAAHAGSLPTDESLSAALATALTAETAGTARTMSSQIATDGADRAAALVLET